MTDHTPRPSTLDTPERIVDTLDRHDALADELATLTDRQRELIESGETEALLDIIERRQEILDVLLGADGLLAGEGAWIDTMRRAPEPMRERAQSLLNRLQGKLAEVMRADERDQNALRARMDETRAEMNTGDRARVAHAAYAGGRPGAGGGANPRFTDRKG